MTQADALPLARCEVVDGVPVVFADVPGPQRAGLVFRVGWSDEQIPLRGATHLVEHLSLSALGQQAYSFNGMVQENCTSLFGARYAG